MNMRLSLALGLALVTLAFAADVCGPGYNPYANRIMTSTVDQSNKGKAPPREVPAALLPYYTRCNTIPVDGSYYADDSNGGRGNHYQFTVKYIDQMVQNNLPKVGRPSAAGDDEYLYAALDAHPIQDGSVIVFGAMTPWVEAIALAHRAKFVTTVEYNRLTYDYNSTTPSKRFRTLQHKDLSTLEAGSFDAAFSMSSFDHDGLGRYGDPLGPDSDLLAMDTVKRLLKPNGVLFLSVPIGPDAVAWNLQRRYGPKRLPLLLGGWQRLGAYGFDEEHLTREWPIPKAPEPVFALRPVAQAPVHTEL